MQDHLKLLARILLFLIATFLVMRALLLVTNIGYFSSLSIVEIITAFVYGVRFDLSIMVAVFFIPFTLSFLPGRVFASTLWLKTISWICFILISIAILALAMDIIFFQKLQRHIGVELIQMKDDSSYLWPMLQSYWLATITYVASIALLAALWQRHITSNIIKLNYSSFKKLMLYPIIFMLMVVIIRGGHVTGKPLGVVNAFISGSIEQANLSLNGVYTAIRVSQRSQDSNSYHYHKFTDEEILSVTGLQKDYPFEQHYKKHDRQPNIILLQIESLAYQFIDGLGNKSYNVTPFLDSLIDRSLVFDQFYASGQRSIIGLQATWTGIPGILGFPTLDNGLSSYRISQVAKIAQEEGYETLFAQSSARQSFRVDALAQSIGFKNYWGKEDVPELTLNYPDGPPPQFGYDFESLMLLKEKIKQHFKNAPKQPVLAGFFSGTMHTPYIKLPQQFELYPHSDKSINGLLNSVAYLDWSLQQFIEGLRDEPWFDNTVFIITADHTATHYLDSKASYQDLFHIPLIIYSENSELIDTKRNHEVRSQLDIMPTIMDLMGSEKLFSAVGNSLFKPKKYQIINDQSYLMGSINEDGYISTDLTHLLETDQDEESAQSHLKHLFMLNQRIAESLQSNTWAH